MKKIIGAFAAGQAVQLLILFVGQSITYETNLFLFSAVLGGLSTLLLLVGSAIATLEYASEAETDMEEAPALPEEIKVSNDRIRRDVTALLERKDKA